MTPAEELLEPGEENTDLGESTLEATNHSPIVTLRGERVMLGPYHSDIKPLLAKLFNDLAVSIPAVDYSLADFARGH